jgi:hypothetical protein
MAASGVELLPIRTNLVQKTLQSYGRARPTMRVLMGLLIAIKAYC